MDYEITDRIIKEFSKTRWNKDELKVLRKFPGLLGDLINFSQSPDIKQMFDKENWDRVMAIRKGEKI